MTYSQTIDYLYSRLPMFSRIGEKAYKKDLTNTLALLKALGNPHHSFKCVHIAGTNGKGSVSHILASIFHVSGYKTGLYTSPHLYDFRERIKTSTGPLLEMCSENFVIDFVKKLKPEIEAIEPSFFEVTVAMAFSYFAEQQVDIAIIETGLGGRLDSTNVLLPELSIITNIGWDHMDILGNTLPEIAFEKAGIIKPNVPVIIGESLAETQPVFEKKARECNAPIYWAEEEWEIMMVETRMAAIDVCLQQKKLQTLVKITCDLPGMYQQYNIRTVVTAVEKLQDKGWKLPNEALVKALTEVKNTTGLWGRWQLIGKNPVIVLDVAHNVNGIEVLLKQITHFEKTGEIEKVHLVMGMVKDKDIGKVLTLLPTHYLYYFTQAQLPRALPFSEMQANAGKFGLTGNGFAEVNEALQAAINEANPKDLIVVCGSIFLVAEVSRKNF